MASAELEEVKRRASRQQVLTPPASSGPGPDKNKPDYKSRAHTALVPLWKMMRDLWGGTRTMREAGELYLPRGAAETVKDFQDRLKRTEFFNAFRRTNSGLTGMVFRRDPELDEDVGETFAAHWENIDNAGTHGAVFARQLLSIGLRDGGAAILVDYPEVDGTLTLAEERARNLRPYWVKVDADQIISARTTMIDGQSVLSQIVLKEVATEADGDFGEVEVTRFRVFRLVHTSIAIMQEAQDAGVTLAPGEMDQLAKLDGYAVTWELWEYQGDPQELTVLRRGRVRNQSRIPVAYFAAGEELSWGYAYPPLEDLAHTNIAHYQVKSDHRFSMHKASVPILVMKGRDRTESEVIVGPNTGIDVSPEGDVKYVEHAGTALNATRTECQDLEAQMAAQGLSMLKRETRSAETAEAKRIDKSAEDSMLGSIARSLQDALEEAAGFHAAYIGDTGGSIQVNMEFEALSFDATFISAVSNLQVANQISLDTLWDILAAGAVLPDTFDKAEEEKRIMDAMTQAVEQMRATAQAMGKVGADGKPVNNDPNKDGQDGEQADPAA
jgi:hypothetical protein